MSTMPIFADPQPSRSITMKDAERFFYQNEDQLLPIPARIRLNDMLTFWSERGFDDLKLETEIGILEEIERRVADLGDFETTDDYHDFISMLQRIDGRGRFHESLAITKRIVQAVALPSQYASLRLVD